MIPKNKPWRSKKYTDWVKTLDCCLCGAPADDPHHIIGIGGFGGTGTKAPDYMTMPACRGCHGRFPQEPELWPSQWEHIVRTLHRAIQEGVFGD